MIFPYITATAWNQGLKKEVRGRPFLVAILIFGKWELSPNDATTAVSPWKISHTFKTFQFGSPPTKWQQCTANYRERKEKGMATLHPFLEKKKAELVALVFIV